MNRTLVVSDDATARIQKIPGVEHVVTVNGYNIIDGSRASNAVTMFITLADWDKRTDKRTSQLGILNAINRQFSEIQDANGVGILYPSLPGIGTSGGFAMQLQDRGGAGLGMLTSLTEEMVADANTQSGLSRVYSTFRSNVPQIYLDIDREQVKAKNVVLQDVFNTLGAFMGSAYVNDFTLDGRTYKVKVQADSKYRITPEAIKQLEVRSLNGRMVKLGSILEVEENFGPQTITHFNIYTAARINGQAAPGHSSGQALDLMEKMAEQKLPNNMGFEWTELAYEEKASSGTATIVFMFSIVIVYLVLAAQYESWSLPFAIVLGVPVALLGAVGGITARGYDFNVYTQIGIVLLIGLSAKTAILIVEFAKAQHEDGMSLRDAALSASRLRFARC